MSVLVWQLRAERGGKERGCCLCLVSVLYRVISIHRLSLSPCLLVMTWNGPWLVIVADPGVILSV